MFVSYRSNKAKGVMVVKTGDLGLAFNRVAQLQIKNGDFPEDYGKQVRYEGRVKINRKNYAAISQAGLIVVAQGPDIPDTIELRT
jgi:hypothetical protein